MDVDPDVRELWINSINTMDTFLVDCLGIEPTYQDEEWWHGVSMTKAVVGVVAEDGSRYIDESAVPGRRGHAWAPGNVYRNPVHGWHPYTVFDQEKYDEYEADGLIDADEVSSNLFRADTVEELAEACGMNPDTLAKTIKNFNVTLLYATTSAKDVYHLSALALKREIRWEKGMLSDGVCRLSTRWRGPLSTVWPTWPRWLAWTPLIFGWRASTGSFTTTSGTTWCWRLCSAFRPTCS